MEIWQLPVGTHLGIFRITTTTESSFFSGRFLGTLEYHPEKSFDELVTVKTGREGRLIVEDQPRNPEIPMNPCSVETKLLISERRLAWHEFVCTGNAISSSLDETKLEDIPHVNDVFDVEEGFFRENMWPSHLVSEQKNVRIKKGVAFDTEAICERLVRAFAQAAGKRDMLKPAKSAGPSKPAPRGKTHPPADLRV